LFNDAKKIFSAKPAAAIGEEILSKNRLAYSLHWMGRTYAQLDKEHDSRDAQTKASKLYAEITGNDISSDPEEALKQYETLVSDD
jgi:hypothetical protein